MISLTNNNQILSKSERHDLQLSDEELSVDDFLVEDKPELA
jgi:hypothetical protein